MQDNSRILYNFVSRTQKILGRGPSFKKSPQSSTMLHIVKQKVDSISTMEHSGILLTSTQPPLFKPLIPFIKLQLRLCNYLMTIPFEWDEVQDRVRLLQSKSHLLICKAQMGIHIAYTLLMTGHFLTPENQKTTKNSTRMVG